MNRRIASVLAVSGLGVLIALSLTADDETDAPLNALETARTMQTPEGFRVSLFAAEPDVRQPISMCIDDRGRLWVAEAYSYPNHSKESQRDRILIFEDKDGDGSFDKRTVFYDKLNYVTGLEVGFGGVWVMSPPYFYFIPDKDGDDRPDGEPEVVLDGFGNFANAHNLANHFAWGPDGWLYGTHGRTNWSMIGKPGDSKEARRRFDGGVYRYHPVTKVWEPYVDGCTNPWGVDWDDYGQAFIPNTVNPHLFHAIPGAHFEPWRNRASSRYAYERIKTIADHLHFAGGGDVRAGIGTDEESDLGGGHSHCGIMVYLGDNWPDEYRNTVLTHNTHGRRINRDILKRSGSGYVATHGPDFLMSPDTWYMGVTLQYGPDGAAYSIDWSDTGECHSVRNTRRGTGRIYHIRYGDKVKKRKPFDVSKMSNSRLVQLQLHRNDWWVRHARRVLQERAARGDDMSDTLKPLVEILQLNPDPTRRLRALWALHGIGATGEEMLLDLCGDKSEYVRAWAVNLLSESKTPSPHVLSRFQQMAQSETETPLVRLHLASMLQRFELRDRWEVAKRLVGHAEDQGDQNLPLMAWYAAEPLVDADVARFAELALAAKVPLVQKHIARRIASLADNKAGLAAMTEVLIQADDQTRSHLIDGLLVGLQGRRRLSAPERWAEAVKAMASNKALHERTLAVSLVFGDAGAVAALRRLASNREAPAEVRERAIEQLVAVRAKGVDAWLLEWMSEPAVRRAAIRGAAGFKRDETPDAILKQYSQLSALARRDALQTLSARKEWAAKLLDAVERDVVPRGDLTAFTVRQIASLDGGLRKRVESQWGAFRSTSRQKQNQIKQLKRQLSSSLNARDRRHGRAVYERNCAACHKLFDAGGNRGPNLTGAQRNSLDYLLEHIVDPNSSVAKDYHMKVVALANGRVLSGLLAAETDTTMTLQTLNEDVVVNKADVESIRDSSLSLMPEKLLDPLTKREVRDLMAYLQGESQAALPPGFQRGKAPGQGTR